MARKKTEVAPESAVEAAAVATEPPAESGNGETRRPEQSWTLYSDRTTCIDVACWLNEYTNQQGESYEQVTFSVQRSYRDQQGQWHRGGAWRTHDIPCFLFLLQKAHNWALERRTLDSAVPL